MINTARLRTCSLTHVDSTFEKSPISSLPMEVGDKPVGQFSVAGMLTDWDRSRGIPCMGDDLTLGGESRELEVNGRGGRFLACFLASGLGSGLLR